MSRLGKKFLVAGMIIWGLLIFGFGCDSNTDLSKFAGAGLGLTSIVSGVILGIHWFNFCKIANCECQCHEDGGSYE